MSEHEQFTSDEQIAYAQILDWGVWIGFIGLIVTGVLYLFGLVTPHIPHADIAKIWCLDLQDYVAQTGMPHEPWSWLALIGESDINVYLPVVLLGLLTIVCYLRIIPSFIKKQEWFYVSVAVAEVLVLSAAATGVLNAGH
jgi:hypothetical protein